MFEIVSNPRGPHQVKAAKELAAGFDRHGIKYKHIDRVRGASAPFVACWGWRNGMIHRQRGAEVLVMERAYLGDRYHWTSLGWNGLNGRAVFPACDDPSRFDRHFSHLMEPWNPNGEYALVLGQVPTDTSVMNVEYESWVKDTVIALKDRIDVRFRPHPVGSGASVRPPCPRFEGGDLLEQIRGARFTVTFNSNSGVESVMAGTPLVTVDQGSMAWDVASHSLDETLFTGDRKPWANRLAWCQWLPEEIESGMAWEHLREVIDTDLCA